MKKNLLGLLLLLIIGFALISPPFSYTQQASHRNLLTMRKFASESAQI